MNRPNGPEWWPAAHNSHTAATPAERGDHTITSAAPRVPRGAPQLAKQSPLRPGRGMGAPSQMGGMHLGTGLGLRAGKPGRSGRVVRGDFLRWVFFDPGWSSVLSRPCRNKSGLDLCPGRSPTCQIGLLPGGSRGQIWQRGRETTDTALDAKQGGRVRLRARAGAWETIPTRGRVGGPSSATRVAGPHLTRCGHTHLR